MNDRNRVGPYRVRRRYRGAGQGAGRVYEAVHAETARPAVLAAPGPAEEWKPEAEWTVRASAGLHPPHISLEVEKAPAGGELAELTLLLHRLAGVVSRLEGRPDAAAHLAGRQVVARRQRRPRRVRWLLMSGSLAAVLLAVLLWPRHLDAPPSVPELADEGVLTDGAADTDGVIGRDLPRKAFKNQKKPPCNPAVETELAGGCWVELAARPPCADELYEAAGKCWMPVLTAPRQPSSVLP